MSDQPELPPRAVYVEIWRPLRYIGRSGPRVFWREQLPTMESPSEGWHLNERGERVPHQNAGRIVWADPSPWRVMDKEAARKIFAMPNSYFTLDEYPRVTFVWRKFKDATLGDYAAVQALRAGAPHA